MWILIRFSTMYCTYKRGVFPNFYLYMARTYNTHRRAGWEWAMPFLSFKNWMLLLKFNYIGSWFTGFKVTMLPSWKSDLGELIFEEKKKLNWKFQLISGPKSWKYTENALRGENEPPPKNNSQHVTEFFLECKTHIFPSFNLSDTF